MSFPGMLYGRVLRSSHPPDRLTSFDPDKIMMLPGVIDVVVDGSFMGVVAERDEQALNAIKVAARSARWHRSRELPPHTENNGWMAGLTAQSTTFIADEGAEPDVTKRHQA